MICLARKKRTAQFRQYVAAETAVPVVACAACLPASEEKNFFFAGVARSKSVRGPDDGIGPSVDEYFTVSIGGMVTVLNTSGEPSAPPHSAAIRPACVVTQPRAHRALHPSLRSHAGRPRRMGLLLAQGHARRQAVRALPVPCCAFHGALVDCTRSPVRSHARRQKTGPRRIGITVASASSPKVIGRALSFAKSGESLDILLKQ